MPQRESLKELLCTLSGDSTVQPPQEESGALPAASTLWVSEFKAPGEYQAQPFCLLKEELRPDHRGDLPKVAGVTFILS